jgi:hypothetical protein
VLVTYVNIPFVVCSYLCPQVDHAILEVLELPKESLVNTRVRVPVLVLSTGNCVQVENNIEIFGCTTLDDSIQSFETRGFYYAWVEIVFKVAIIERNADAVHALACKVLGIGTGKEII